MTHKLIYLKTKGSSNSLKAFFFSFVLLSIYGIGYAEVTGDQQPPKRGNFALSSSQQPAPLLSFGQLIINAKQTQAFLFGNDFKGVNSHHIDAIPSILHAFTDNLSLFLALPVAASYKIDKARSSGLGDALLQLEYAYYTKSTTRYTTQSTLLTSVLFPTGSIRKDPPTGFGSTSYFIGTTTSRMYEDWYIFGSTGGILTTSRRTTKYGNNFLYQCGLGRNIFSIPSKLIVAWLVEVNGTYAGKDRIEGQIDPNSGGNAVYIIPSLWVSTPRWIFQLGVGPVVTQHLFGNQKKNKLLAAFDIGLTF